MGKWLAVRIRFPPLFLLFVLGSLPAAAQIRTTNDLLRDSSLPAADVSGRFVSLTSYDDLAADGSVGQQVFVRDAVTGAFTRVTYGVGLGRSSLNGGISADGNVLVFSSDSDMLHEGRPQNTHEIWMYRRDEGQLTRLTDALATATNRDAINPVISADGSRIVFQSDADLLDEGGFPFPTSWFVWLYEAPSATLRRLTPTSGSEFPSISADGRWVAFESTADFHGEGLDGADEIWLCDLNDFSLRRITDARTNGGLDRDSGRPTISADGGRIAFAGTADLLSEGLPFNPEVWLYDVRDEKFTRVTNCGTYGGGAEMATISPDGSFIVLRGNFLLTGPPSGGNWRDLWRYDIADARLTRLTNTHAQGNLNRYSTPGPANAISGDGRHIVFSSDADLHNDGVQWGQTEVWMFSTFPPGQDALAVR